MGKVFSSKKIMQLLDKDGWREINCEGDHHQFKHPVKTGKVTVQGGKKNLSKHVVASIERQSCLKF